LTGAPRAWLAAHRERARPPKVIAAGLACGLVGLMLVASGSVGASPAHGASARPLLTGSLSGFPEPSSQVLEYVQAISLRNGTVAAAAVPSGGRYSMSVRRGPYMLVVRVLDLRGGRTITKSSHAVLVGSSPRTVNIVASAAVARVRARAAASSAGVTVGIGRIPISIDVPGYQPGGSVEGGMIDGLLRGCQADGGKLVDVTKAVKDDLRTEQKLSDEGRTAVKFQLNPLAPALVIEGGVKVDANGKPVADINVVDPKTGKVIDHIVVGGDPGEIAQMSPFLSLIGKGIAARACRTKKATKKGPKPRKHPAPSCGGLVLRVHQICFVFDGSVSGSSSVHPFGYTGSAHAQAHMVWVASWPSYKGLEAIKRAMSTASGFGDITWDKHPPTDCHMALGLTSNDTNLITPNGASTNPQAHVLIPFFRDDVSATCPADSVNPSGYDAAADSFDGGSGPDVPSVMFTYRVAAGRTTTAHYGPYAFASPDGRYSSTWSGTMTAVAGPGVY
jgi:hypothetical protein